MNFLDSNSPYIKTRFVINGVVKAIHDSLPTGSNLKIYTEKLDKIEPPFIFVSVENIVLRNISDWLNFKDYLILIHARFGNAPDEYAKLDDLACLLYECLEFICLPVANSLKEGPQPKGLMLPVKGDHMTSSIHIDKSYSELNFYINYSLQIFKENPYISKMKEQNIKIKRKDK